MKIWRGFKFGPFRCAVVSRKIPSWLAGGRESSGARAVAQIPLNQHTQSTNRCSLRNRRYFRTTIGIFINLNDGASSHPEPSAIMGAVWICPQELCEVGQDVLDAPQRKTQPDGPFPRGAEKGDRGPIGPASNRGAPGFGLVGCRGEAETGAASRDGETREAGEGNYRLREETCLAATACFFFWSMAAA
jgi:hypothetical protein